MGRSVVRCAWAAHPEGVDLMSETSSKFPPRLSRSAKVLHRWRPVLADHTDCADQLLSDAQQRLPDLAARVAVPSSPRRASLGNGGPEVSAVSVKSPM